MTDSVRVLVSRKPRTPRECPFAKVDGNNYRCILAQPENSLRNCTMSFSTNYQACDYLAVQKPGVAHS